MLGLGLEISNYNYRISSGKDIISKNNPSLYLDFTKNLNKINKTPATNSLTVTRASGGTYQDASGVLTSFTNNQARIGNNGLLVEEQKTNFIRNNTMVGASAPSTFPTNWVNTSVTGITTNVIGTGVEDGIEYIDMRISGSRVSTGVQVITLDSLVTASQNQIWSLTSFVKLVSGSLTGISAVTLSITERNTTGGALTGSNGDITSFLTNNNLRNNRASVIRTLNNALTVNAAPEIRITVSANISVDLTIRIGLPQIELGANVTSPIKTSGTTVTREADKIALPNPTAWWNSSGGNTLYIEYISPFVLFNTSHYVSLSASNSSTNNIYLQSTTTSSGISCNVGGVSQAGSTFPGFAPTARQNIKRASVLNTNDFRQAFNSVVSANVDTSGTIPTSLNNSWIGSQWDGNANYCNTYIKSVANFNSALSNTILGNITT
jgi:hypothetical protein